MDNSDIRDRRLPIGVMMLSVFALVGSCLAADPSTAPSTVGDPEKVRAVLAGELSEANAAWWGFDEQDATSALQAAIRSGARKLVVPNMGKPWICGPIKLASNQEIVFEPDVVILAKEGEFKEKWTPFLLAHRCDNVTLRGYGATIQMRKQDYQDPSRYAPSEHRHAVAIFSSTQVKVLGLTIRDSGGDGVIVATPKGEDRSLVSQDILIQDVVCDNNHRQGISVTSVRNLLIERCVLKNTSGTPPMAGIDLEPDQPEDQLSDVIVRDCTMENNDGTGALVYLKKLNSGSQPVSILIENCQVRGSKAYGLSVGAVAEDGPSGVIEFRNCAVENTTLAGGYVYDKAARSALVRFVNCRWSDVARGPALTGDPEAPPLVPISIFLRQPHMTTQHGGVEFIDCTVTDDQAGRPAVLASELKTNFGVSQIRGTIRSRLIQPRRGSINLGTDGRDNTLVEAHE